MKTFPSSLQNNRKYNVRHTQNPKRTETHKARLPRSVPLPRLRRGSRAASRGRLCWGSRTTSRGCPRRGGRAPASIVRDLDGDGCCGLSPRDGTRRRPVSNLEHTARDRYSAARRCSCEGTSFVRARRATDVREDLNVRRAFDHCSCG